MPRNKLTSKHLQKPYISTTDLAKFLGVSRVAVFKKIRKGQIKAEKFGRNYLVPREELLTIVGQFVPENRRKNIDHIVDRITKEYGDTLRRLGKE